MREGDTGEDVYTLQARLFELGYYNGRIDGRYSSETTAAVKAFQKANGLGADGIAGKGTMNKLNSGNAVAAETTDDDIADEPETTYQPETAYTVLRRGDKSDQVEVMQRYLATLGYLNTTPDGQFGSGTERAVKLFQEANGLKADGVAGSGTLSILYSGNAVSYNAYFGASGGSTTVSPTAVPDMTTVIQWESEGDNVRQYQQRLVELGYLNSKYVTGKFNQKTVEATKAFQTMNDLKVDGAAASVMAYDVPRFLHLTNGKLYYVASEGGEDCVIRLNTQSGSREVLARVGVALKFALCDGVMYTLDANAALKERTLSGEESELMTGVSDFTLDATGKALLCVTQDGVVSFGIQTGQSEMVYTGAADQAAMCGQALLVRAGGSIVRVMNGQMATIRRDGATCLLVYGQKVIELTGRGVMTCDVNGENATTIANGSFEAASIANGVLYLGGADGYTQSVSL